MMLSKFFKEWHSYSTGCFSRLLIIIMKRNTGRGRWNSIYASALREERETLFSLKLSISLRELGTWTEKRFFLNFLIRFRLRYTSCRCAFLIGCVILGLIFLNLGTNFSPIGQEPLNANQPYFGTSVVLCDIFHVETLSRGWWRIRKIEMSGKEVMTMRRGIKLLICLVILLGLLQVRPAWVLSQEEPNLEAVLP